MRKGDLIAKVDETAAKSLHDAALALIDSLDHTVDRALAAGVITRSDKLRVALERNKLEAKELQLKNGILLASHLLCHQMGISYPENGLVLENNLDNAGVFTTVEEGAFSQDKGAPVENP